MAKYVFRDWVFVFVLIALSSLGFINRDLFLAMSKIIYIFFALFIFMIASNSRKVSGMTVVLLIAIAYFWMAVYDLFAIFSEEPY